MIKAFLEYFNDDDFFTSEKKLGAVDKFKKLNHFNKLNNILDSSKGGLVKL